MDIQLSGRKVLVLVSNGVDEAVMSTVQRDMLKTGATIKTVGTESGLVNSWNSQSNGWGLYFPVDQQIGQTLGSDFDALVVPAGARSVQKLGANPHAERIISSFITAGKPMAFMGDAVELLAKIELAKGFTVTGPERSHQILVAAGAVWNGAAEHVDGMLMTGDGEDMSGFIQNMAAHIASGPVEEQQQIAA
ncbi:MAG: DJ-1/PfpI family protein [Alphaproteobacteria bacterium]|nr:DJ-1/PfpI family protein [Alphaproteobacteria bacterium]HRI75462.1 DJ-1/PfpI family protein [Alphaproteobacteria bacterium]